MQKVAITGGIACGKSQVCKFLQDEGAYVVDADQIVHQLLNSDTTLNRQIVELLGKDVLVDGKIDRHQIANKVFSNPKLLNSLEAFLHPLVYEKVEEQFKEVQMRPHLPPLFVAEIPLLFETGGERYFDKTIAVFSDYETCQKRYQMRKQKNSSDFEKRMARQMDVKEKANRADFIIENRGSLEDLQKESKKLFYNLINLSN